MGEQSTNAWLSELEQRIEKLEAWRETVDSFIREVKEFMEGFE